ncbi:MAG: GCN5-like N-acetyltransferase [Chloroflexi bacterium]|nr:GCN5-like N-acetyltransferase [Chloroflexota bacterium]
MSYLGHEHGDGARDAEETALAGGIVGAAHDGLPESSAEAAGRTERDILMRRPDLEDIPELEPLPPDFALRRARPDEVSALATLLTRAFAVPWDDDLVRRRLSEAPDVEAIYVVAHAGVPVATASARLAPEEHPGSGYLHWVGADPDYQGKGLGRLVVVRVLMHFREAGLRDAVLETQVHNFAALRTYLRLGFVPEYREADDRRRWSRVLPRLLR